MYPLSRVTLLSLVISPTEIIGVAVDESVHEVRRAAGPGTRLSPIRRLWTARYSSWTTALRARCESARAKRIVVAIDSGCHSRWKRSTHVIALHEASGLGEVREAHAHPVLERRHPEHEGQLQRHEVAKMNGGEACQEPRQGIWVA